MDIHDLTPAPEPPAPHDVPADGQYLAPTPELQTSISEKQVWGAWTSVAFGLAVLAAFIGAQFLVILVFFLSKLISNPSTNLMQILGNVTRSQEGLIAAVSTIVSAVVCIPLIAIFVKIRGKTSFREYIGLRHVSKKALLFWLAILLGLIILSQGISFFVKQPADDFTQRLYSTAGWLPLLWFALIICAPAFEETFFRGFLFEGFRQSRIGAVAAIILTALSWSLLHIQYNLVGIGTIFVLGLVLGIARLKTNSLWTTLLMHASWNLVAVIEVGLLLFSGSSNTGATAMGERFVLQSDLTGLSSLQAEKTMDATTQYIKTKLDESGVTTLDIQRTGKNQIVMKVPVKNTIAVLSVLRAPVKSSLFEFGEPAQPGQAALWEDSSGKWNPAFGTVNGQIVELTSKYFVGNTSVRSTGEGQANLTFEWDATGTQLSRQITAGLAGRPLAVFDGSKPLVDQDGKIIELSGDDVTGAGGTIVGLPFDEAQRISTQINASRLMRGIRIIEMKEY